MTPEEAIEMLRGMQNKKVDYAEMVCAPAFVYGYEYVYPEPEDYAIEEAIKALKEIQQYREIGTVEECRGAVEKQKPKKPLLKSKKKKITIGNYIYVTCPSCGETIFHASCSSHGTKLNVHIDTVKIVDKRLIGQLMIWRE